MNAADMELGSWSNQIQPYQWYIHGDGKTSRYLGLSADFKNPASDDGKGMRISIVCPFLCAS